MKVIIRSKSEYDKGTYQITGGKWSSTIWSEQLNGVVKDIKADGNTVYINDWYTPKGSFERKEFLKKI